MVFNVESLSVMNAWIARICSGAYTGTPIILDEVYTSFWVMA